MTVASRTQRASGDREGPHLAVTRQHLDVVHFAIAADAGFGADDAAVVLPPDTLHRLAKRRTVALSDQEVALSRTVCSAGRCQPFTRASRAAYGEHHCKEHVFGQHTHGRSGLKLLNPREVWWVAGAIATRGVTIAPGHPAPETGWPRGQGTGRTSTRMRRRLPGSKGVSVAYLRPL